MTCSVLYKRKEVWNLKIYQLIYTSVLYSLSDVSKGLVNQPGYRVYSCSEKLTKEEINEVVRYASYRLPRSEENSVYSKVPSDPEVPEKFPKTFRSFKMKNGKTALIQSVFAGYDYTGKPGNFFAHVLIVENPPAGFRPEQYIGSPDFRTHLTEKEAYRQIVKYLPELKMLRRQEDFDTRIDEFIKGHKDEVSYLWEKYMYTLSKGKNLCIAAETESDAQLYIMALKTLLPCEIDSGFSTYNVYMPSDKHREINLHATILGKNNITQDSINMHKSCVYVDMSDTDFTQTMPQIVIDMPLEKLHKAYAKYRLDTPQKLDAWLDSYDGVSAVGMKLMRILKICGEKAFADRALELYAKIDKEEMSAIRFEIIRCMYERIDLFPQQAETLSKRFLKTSVEKLCIGDDFDIEPYFTDELSELRGGYSKSSLRDIMEVLRRYYPTMGGSQKLLILRSWALIKQAQKYGSWKEFLGGNDDYLSVFVQTAADVMIQYGVPVTFSAPSMWTPRELCEMIAYFDAGTENEAVKSACFNYIISNQDMDWEHLGVEFTSRLKTDREDKAFFDNLHRRLKLVGYTPYSGGSYTDLRMEIEEEAAKGRATSLFTRLMIEYYSWLDAVPMEKKESARRVKNLLLRIKKEQPKLYDFLIPKFAIEVLDSQSNYQEEIITSETMCPSFWNWFLIGYRRKSDDVQTQNVYQHVYLANRSKLAQAPNRNLLRREFAHAVKAEKGYRDDTYYEPDGEE